MNNKGQVLVIFILLIPILFLILAVLIEIGDLLVYQNKLESNAKYIINYGLEKLEDTKLPDELQTLNKENLDGKAKINITNKEITVSIKQKKKNIFNFIKIPITVEFTYKGQIKNGKKYISKE